MATGDTTNVITSLEEWKVLLEAEEDMDILQALKETVKLKNEALFREWEEKEFDPKHEFQVKNDTDKIVKLNVLHIAIQLQILHIVSKVLHHFDVNERLQNGGTPLLDAVLKSSEDVIQYLLENGADVNLKNSLNATPMLAAFSRGDVNIIKLLIAHNGDLNVTDKRGYAPVHLAAMKGHIEALKFLIEEILVDYNVLNAGGLSPLYLALHNDYKETVWYLLKEKNAKVDNGSTDPRDSVHLLHIAAYNGNLDILRYLLEVRKADICVLNVEGETCLHYAIRGRNAVEVAKYLVEKDDRLVNIADRFNFYPLHQAIFAKKLELVKYLIEEKGADYMEEFKIHWTELFKKDVTDAYSAFGRYDFTSENEVSSLHIAASAGNIDIFKYLRDNARIDEIICDIEGITPLHVACWNGHKDIVKYIIEDCGIQADYPSLFQLTPLHLACRGGHLHIVEYLVDDKKAKINIKDNKHWTPLHFACKHGSLEIVKFLLDRNAEINVTDLEKRTPLHMAAASGNVEMVKFMVNDLKADYNARNSQDVTPLYVTAIHCHMELLKYFIEEVKVNFVEPDEFGWTLLYLASVNKCDMKVIKYLVEKGSSVDVKTEKGRTVASGAVCSGHLDVLKYLIDEKKADVNNVDENGHTLLSTAVEKGHLDIVKYLIEEIGLDILVTDINGRTLLHQGVHSGNFELLDYLLQKDELHRYLDAQTSDNGRTPLVEAASKGYEKIAVLLLEKGALPDVRNTGEYTPLMKASQRGDLNVVKALVKHKADVNIVNVNGETALHRAARNQQVDVFKYLVANGAKTDVKSKYKANAVDILAKTCDDRDVLAYCQRLRHKMKVDNKPVNERKIENWRLRT